VDHPRVIDLFNTTKAIRSLFPVIANADFVVAPDSSVNHIAAGLDTACVSLWGSYDPHDRMTYYPKNVSVFKPDTCPHAPCRPHAGLPQAKCKDASNRLPLTQYWCNAIRNIKPYDIVAASMEAMELEDKIMQDVQPNKKSK
jgi:hypothetical protein